LDASTTPWLHFSHRHAAAHREAANIRVANRRLHADLGYALKFPTFREGLTAELARLGLWPGETV
jgi:hypothetical protein